MRSVRQERGGERVEAAKAHDAGHTSGAERPGLCERWSWLQTADGAPENGLHLKRGLGLRAARSSDPQKNYRTHGMVENFGARIAGVLMGRECMAKFTRSMESAERLRCAVAAPAREITKTRTVRRGRRTMEKMRSATVQNAQPQKSFLLRTDKQLAVGCSRRENTLRARDEAVSEKFDPQKRVRLLLRN
jgi:hypothetical protein